MRGGLGTAAPRGVGALVTDRRRTVDAEAAERRRQRRIGGHRARAGADAQRRAVAQDHEHVVARERGRPAQGGTGRAKRATQLRAGTAAAGRIGSPAAEPGSVRLRMRGAARA
jgi:hypothetical protein